MTRLVVLLACLLAGCGGGSSPSPPPTPVVTIPDVGAFLVTSRCPDGMLAVLEPCAGVPQTASDPMLYRRHDASGHTDGQIEDAFVENSYFVNTFSFMPGAPFDPVRGDGGDVIVSDGHIVSIAYTQNGLLGGGTIAGYWAGLGCLLGTGWVLFDDQAPTGSWKSEVAMLAPSLTPGACPRLNPAFTQWRLETLPITFTVGGQTHTVSLPSIISEHYAGLSIASASSMERFVMAQGVGRVLWQAWATTGPSEPFLPSGIWDAAPGPGWYLKDERLLTDVEPGGSMTGSQFGWPPAGFVP